MSVFEGLSLLVSTIGTLGSVFIGMRQLRQGAPVAQATAYAPPPTVYAPPPQHPGGYRPSPQQPPGYAQPHQPTVYAQPHQPTVYAAAPVRPATRPGPQSGGAGS